MQVSLKHFLLSSMSLRSLLRLYCVCLEVALIEGLRARLTLEIASGSPTQASCLSSDSIAGSRCDGGMLLPLLTDIRTLLLSGKAIKMIFGV